MFIMVVVHSTVELTPRVVQAYSQRRLSALYESLNAVTPLSRSHQLKHDETCAVKQKLFLQTLFMLSL